MSLTDAEKTEAAKELDRTLKGLTKNTYVELHPIILGHWMAGMLVNCCGDDYRQDSSRDQCIRTVQPCGYKYDTRENFHHRVLRG